MISLLEIFDTCEDAADLVIFSDVLRENNCWLADKFLKRVGMRVWFPQTDGKLVATKGTKFHLKYEISFKNKSYPLCGQDGWAMDLVEDLNDQDICKKCLISFKAKLKDWIKEKQ